MQNLIHGACEAALDSIEPGSIALTITSPPYNISKAYDVKRSISDYVEWQEGIIRQIYIATKDGGSVCWQVGNYVSDGAVYPIDCLLFSSFIDAGFVPRNRIVWTFGHGLHCKNRFSGRHETVLWFTKGNQYKFNLDSVRVPQKYPSKRHYKGPNKGKLSGNPLGKNPGDVWDISNVKNNHPEKTEHPCQFPESLCDRLIMSLSSGGDTVLDPFMGSGTVGASCLRLGREFTGIEMDAGYFDIAKRRLDN